MSKEKLTNGQIIVSHIKAFVKRWNEVFLLPLAIILWVYSGAFLRWIDPTSATYDSGVLQKHLYAVIGTLIAHFTVWVLLKLSFPHIHTYIYRRFEFDLLDESDQIKSSTILNERKWAKLRYSFLFICLYLFTYLAVLFTV